MENYQQYLESFKNNIKEAIDNLEDESAKDLLKDIEPFTEAEWKEAIDSGFFNIEFNEDQLKQLYNEINEKYPEEEN